MNLDKILNPVDHIAIVLSCAEAQIVFIYAMCLLTINKLVV